MLSAALRWHFYSVIYESAWLRVAVICIRVSVAFVIASIIDVLITHCICLSYSLLNLIHLHLMPVLHLKSLPLGSKEQVICCLCLQKSPLNCFIPSGLPFIHVPPYQKQGIMQFNFFVLSTCTQPAFYQSLLFNFLRWRYRCL